MVTDEYLAFLYPNVERIAGSAIPHPKTQISLQRAAQVYGTRSFIAVVSNAAPNPGYYSLKDNHQLPSTQRRVQLQPKGP